LDSYLPHNKKSEQFGFSLRYFDPDEFERVVTRN